MLRTSSLIVLALCLSVPIAACGARGSNPASGSSGGGDDAGPDASDEGGGATDGGGGATVQTCPGYTAGAPAGCTTTAATGGAAGTLITGTILAPGQILRGGQVAIDANGNIACVACDCSASAAGAAAIVCPSGVVSPGLVNSHDHITYTQDSPLHDTGERYEHRNDWRKGENGHTELTVPGGASKAQVSWGEVRFLLGGATSTVGSGGEPGLLRNLDVSSDQGGLGEKAVDFDTFPLGDSSGVELATGCGYPTIVSLASVQADDAYYPHVAEGVASAATNEFACLSSNANGGHDITLPQTAMIHGVGLGASQYADMAANGTSLIWSPRSNTVLYGNTAVVTAADRLGVRIALGTDWIASGSMNMLRELRCADSWNKTYFGGHFTDQRLWEMATVRGAEVASMQDKIGSLATGMVADVAIFDGSARADYRAVIDADPQDVLLVMRGGKVLYGDAALVADATCDALSVCGKDKKICIQSELAETYDALSTAAGDIYASYFCGDPTDEPTCVPSRPAAVNGSTIYTGTTSADDSDGDGVPDATDDCPGVFNPVRPMDDGAQADADGDGAGDACDPCPVLANVTSCAPVQPDGGTVTSEAGPVDSGPLGDGYSPSRGLVINEIDYDQPGTDAAEFLEVYNPTAASIPLAGIQVVFVNGALNSVYTTIDLSPAGSLASGAYLVVGVPAVTATLADAGVATIDFAAATNQIQNGSPDGVALVDSNTAALLDAVSYGGSITAAVIPGIGTVSLVEGTPTTAQDSNTVAGSICRIPNGSDTNDAATDWVVCATPTPGAANQP